MNYKKEIIQMLKELNDERFLKYIHTLLKEMLVKSARDNARVG